MSTFQCSCAYCGAQLIRKQEMSRYFCNIQCKSEWQKRADKPVSEEWLRDAYLVLGMNCTQIAHEVSRDPKSVWRWLRGFGIETRKRGTTGNHVYALGVPRVLTDAGREKLSAQAKAARAKDKRHPAYIDGVHWLKHPKHAGRKAAAWKGGITPERQSLYSSLEWKDAVKAIWRKQDAKCANCGLDCRTLDYKRRAFAIHHVDSFKIAARRADPTNLVLLCRQCHLWVHSRKNTERRFLGEGH